MSNFDALGQLVTEARNLLDSIKGGAIRVMQTQFDDLITSLNDTFSSKLANYQQQVSSVVKPTIQNIYDAFEFKIVDYDPVNGDDNNVNGPFRTLNAAVQSVPNGGWIMIRLPSSGLNGEEITLELSEGRIDIGSRRVLIRGAHPAVDKYITYLKPTVSVNIEKNSAQYDCYFTGKGGYLEFHNCGLIVPRDIPGYNANINTPRFFIADSLHFNHFCDVDYLNYEKPHVYVVDNGTSELAMPICLAASRAGRKSLQSVTLSHLLIELDQKQGLINLQHRGTLTFSIDACVLSDKSGEPVEWGHFFSGLTYGTHGYATNLVAVESITKKVAA